MGRRKASAPAPFFEVQGKSWASVLPQWEDRRKGARRIASMRLRLVRLSALRLPSCLEAGLSWRSLFRMRSHFPRERKRLSFLPASAGRKERRPLPRGRAEG